VGYEERESNTSEYELLNEDLSKSLESHIGSAGLRACLPVDLKHKRVKMWLTIEGSYSVLPAFDLIVAASHNGI
jgi:hypothetical protein